MRGVLAAMSSLMKVGSPCPSCGEILILPICDNCGCYEATPMTTTELLYHHWPQTPRSGSIREIPDVTRDDLAELFAELEFNRGVEIGTEFGVYALTLCRANPKLKLFCVDPYESYSDYREHKSQEKLDRMYEEATRLLAPPFKVWFHRERSVKASEQYAKESVDFVYIDGNHSLPYVIDDLQAWVPKVRKGGIVSGHDYIRRNNSLRYQCHVVEAVNAWVQCYQVNPLFIVGTKDEVAGQKRDIIRSWFWIKE